MKWSDYTEFAKMIKTYTVIINWIIVRTEQWITQDNVLCHIWWQMHRTQSSTHGKSQWTIFQMSRHTPLEKTQLLLFIVASSPSDKCVHQYLFLLRCILHVSIMTGNSFLLLLSYYSFHFPLFFFLFLPQGFKNPACTFSFRLKYDRQILSSDVHFYF